jgi:hypothetical protein
MADMTDQVRRSSQVSIDGGPLLECELATEREVEYVRSLHAVKPDTQWAFVDSQGHQHQFAEGRALPTLTPQSEHVPCDGSCGGVCEGEGYHITVYTCSLCGDVVEPSWVPDHDAMTVGTPVVIAESQTLTVLQDPGLRDYAYGSELPVRVQFGDRWMTGVGWINSLQVTTWPVPRFALTMPCRLQPEEERAS